VIPALTELISKFMLARHQPAVSGLQLKILVPGQRRFRARITDPGYSVQRYA